MKANSNDTLQKHCTKFKRFYGFESDNRVPVIYMHLKSKGIPKIDALKFCSKNICKTDSTKKKDGPVNYRILKIKPNPYNTINVINYLYKFINKSRVGNYQDLYMI